jgi:UDP-N-acetylmuramate dehydrogenase
MAFGYRSSALKDSDPTRVFLLAAHLKVRSASPEQLQARMLQLRAERERRLPRRPSCGCVFRNPPEEPAGRLIQRLGLSGLRRGDAIVSTHHANFIINAGAATARDVLDLMREVRRCVYDATGIGLIPEVQLVGFEPAVTQELQPSAPAARGRAEGPG